jgi:hypothetical protein
MEQERGSFKVNCAMRPEVAGKRACFDEFGVFERDGATK